MIVSFHLTGPEAIADAFLFISCLALAVQSWWFSKIRDSQARAGFHRTAACRVACALIYVAVGVNAIWGQYAVTSVPLGAFLVTQLIWMANGGIDVRDGKRHMASLQSEAHVGDYTPADFGWGSRDPEQDPSLLTQFTFDGVSFGSMHVDVVGLFKALLTELVPLIPGGLAANQCGCYNPNSVTVGGDRSFHTYAIAIDINWGANPMYAAAQPTGVHALPAATSGVARKYGCEWGGDWTYPQDWMHIECQLSPADARAFNNQNTPAPQPVEDEDMTYIIYDRATPSRAALVDGGVVVVFTDGADITSYRSALAVKSVPVSTSFFNRKAGTK